jgi:hypothetical protein
MNMIANPHKLSADLVSETMTGAQVLQGIPVA